MTAHSTNSTSLREAIEKRGTIWKQMDELLKKAETEKRMITEEEGKFYEFLEKQWGELDEHVTRHGKMESRNMAEASRISGNFSNKSNPYSDFEETPYNEEAINDQAPVFTIQKRTKETGMVADWYLRNHDVSEAAQKVTPGELILGYVQGSKDPIVKRALETGIDAKGGYTVPEIIMAKIIDQLRAKSHVIAAGAKTIVLNSKLQKIAKIASDPTAAWVAENASITPSDPTLEAVAFTAKKIVAEVLASGEILQDSVNIAKVIEMTLIGALATEIDRAALLGSGIGEEPKGLINYAAINTHSMGVNGGQLTSYDAILEAIKMIYDENGETPTTAIMNPRSWLALSKLKDSAGQPLALPPALSDMIFRQTSKIPTNQTQGSSSVASSVFLGGFDQLYLGSRLD